MYDDFHITVIELMKEFGTSSAKLIKQVTGEYDPAVGEVLTVDSEITVEAILTDLTLQSNGLSTKYQTLVEAGDKEVFIRPSKVTPFVLEMGDRLYIGGHEYKVVSAKEINPTANEPILFSAYLRR